MILTPAIFLDRDGVINENRPDYVRRWADMAIFPAALDALVRVAPLPFSIVVVTNQSAVGRGLMTLGAVAAINRQLVATVAAAGGRIDAVYTCPHAPEAGCLCRKPRPGLLRQAATEMGLDLARSILVGDALTDLEAGRTAGLARVALVRTGRGQAQSQLPAATTLRPFPIYDDLADALAGLLPPPGLA